jgi:hypothetical protein
LLLASFDSIFRLPMRRKAGRAVFGRSNLLQPYEPSLIKRYPVSTRVTLVKNDDPEFAMELKQESVTA